ncbi:MAG TPA: hypothetical protein VIG37_04030 [Methylomirabilota bacterium]
MASAIRISALDRQSLRHHLRNALAPRGLARVHRRLFADRDPRGQPRRDLEVEAGALDPSVERIGPGGHSPHLEVFHKLATIERRQR